jgi:hypothetical protein
VTRRLATLALGAVLVVGAGLGATGCSTVDPPAATIASHEISGATIRDEVRDLAKAKLPFNAGQDPNAGRPGTVPADYTRAWLSLRIQYEIFHRVAQDAGITATPDQVQAERSRLQQALSSAGAASNPWDAVPASLQDYLATRGAEVTAVSAAPNADELRQRALDLGTSAPASGSGTRSRTR